MEVTKISQEAFQKVLETLGLSKAVEPAVDEAAVAAEAAKKEELKKAEEAKVALEAEYKEILKKAEELKAKIEGKAEESVTTLTKATEGASTTIAVTPAEFPKEAIEAIQKGFDEKISALALIVAKKDEENEELRKSVSEQSEFLSRLGQKIGMIEKQPLERKSLTGAKFVERFEKAEGAGEEEKVLSLSNLNDRGKLADVMFKALTEKGFSESGVPVDRELEKALRSVELGFLGGTPQESSRIAARLKNEHKIVVVK